MNQLLSHLLHLFAQHEGDKPSDPVRPVYVTASTDNPETTAIINWEGRAWLIQVTEL